MTVLIYCVALAIVLAIVVVIFAETSDTPDTPKHAPLAKGDSGVSQRCAIADAYCSGVNERIERRKRQSAALEVEIEGIIISAREEYDESKLRELRELVRVKAEKIGDVYDGVLMIYQRDRITEYWLRKFDISCNQEASK